MNGDKGCAPENVSAACTPLPMSATGNSSINDQDRPLGSRIRELILYSLKSPIRLLLLLVILPRILWKPLVFLSLGGILAFLVAVFGASLAVGWGAAWPEYRKALPWSPLFGPGLVAFVLIFGGILSSVSKIKRSEYVIPPLLFGLMIGLGAYYGARDEYSRLQPENAGIQSLSISTTEQAQSLSRLSQSGTNLLDQLQKTQAELSKAQSQLRLTLATFESERSAADQISSRLSQLDQKQKAIALRTEELNRILDGKQPITLEDLRHSGNMGLFWGLVIGVFASILANVLTRLIMQKPETARK